MTIDPLFLAGLVVLALLTVSPGADMALVAKIALESGVPRWSRCSASVAASSCTRSRPRSGSR